jgi:hypothetical protein
VTRNVLPADELGRLRQFALAADQRRRLHRQVRRPVLERTRGAEVPAEPRRDQLEQPLRFCEIAQAVLAEIAHLDVDEVSRRLGQEHLLAVGGVADPGCAVDIEPDVARAAALRLARVDAHPDAHAVEFAEGALRVGCGGDRVVGTGESDEEAVALNVDLVSVVLRHRVADQCVVTTQNLPVAVTEHLQQPRRSLDVGEEQRYRPGRELGHALNLTDRRSCVSLRVRAARARGSARACGGGRGAGLDLSAGWPPPSCG